MPKYLIDAYATKYVRVYVPLTVEAENPEQAELEANEMLENNPDLYDFEIALVSEAIS